MLIFATISEKINNSLETSKNFVKNVGDTTINKSENITNSAINTFTNTNTITKNLIQDNLNKVNNATDLVSNTLQSSVQSLWNHWVANHWAIAFVVSHPIIAIVLLITVILTIWGLIQMIPSLLVNFWLLMFKSPFIFGKSLLNNNNNQEVVTENFNSNQEELLKQILTKLEMMEKEQKNIKEKFKKDK
jgi:hypothetical protein